MTRNGRNDEGSSWDLTPTSIGTRRQPLLLVDFEVHSTLFRHLVASEFSRLEEKPLETKTTMKNLSGRLRGPRLSAAVWAISCFCVIIFAYNAAVVGGVLGVVSFQRQFPQMDTIGTSTSREDALDLKMLIWLNQQIPQGQSNIRMLRFKVRGDGSQSNRPFQEELD